MFIRVLPASALLPSFSSCLLPTLLILIYCHVFHLCLIGPAFLFIGLDLPSCAMLSLVKVSIVLPRDLFYMFGYLREALHLLDWIYFQTVYCYKLEQSLFLLSRTLSA